MSLSPRFWICDSELLKIDRCDSSASKAARSARRRAGWSAIVPCRTMRRPAWSSLRWCRVTIRLRPDSCSRVDTLVEKFSELELRNQCLCVAGSGHVDAVCVDGQRRFEFELRVVSTILAFGSSQHLNCFLSSFDCMSIALLLYQAMSLSLHVMNLPALVYPQSSYLKSNVSRSRNSKPCMSPAQANSFPSRHR